MDNKTFNNYLSVENYLKPILSAQIYSTIGIGLEVINLLDSLLKVANFKGIKNNLRNKIFILISNGFRDLGLYKKAREYSELIRHSDLIESIIYHNRIAGDYWLSGNYFKSFYHFILGIRIAKFSIKRFKQSKKVSQIFPNEYYELLDNFLHLFRDFKNLPFIGKLIPLNYGEKFFLELIENKEFIIRRPRTKAGLIQLYHEIPGIRRIYLPEWLKGLDDTLPYFYETDSILGVINSSRYKIKIKIKNNEKINFNELQLLYFYSRLIGDLPGILKASMLIKKIFNSKFICPKKELERVEWVLIRKVIWTLQWYWYSFIKFL